MAITAYPAGQATGSTRNPSASPAPAPRRGVVRRTDRPRQRQRFRSSHRLRNSRAEQAFPDPLLQQHGDAGHLCDRHGAELAHQLRPLSAHHQSVRHTGVVAERPDGAVISFTSSSGTYTPDSDVDLKLHHFRQHMDADRPERQFRNLFYERQRRRSAIHHAAEQVHAGPHLFARPDCFCVGFLHPETDLRLFVRAAFDRLHAGIHERPHLQLCRTSRAPGRICSQTVTYATSPATHQTYLYENANYPYALTGITDENGNRYATWGYDANGRGILSRACRRGELHERHYDDTTGNRVVKGPLGIVETYKFTNLQGVPKVTEIDRAANSPVAAASETFAYDFERLPQQPE